MKNLILLSLSFLTLLSSHSQITHHLTIKNTKGQPLRNVTVTAENTTANDRLTSNTNQAGSATFTLTATGTYTFSYLKEMNVFTLDVLEGYSGSSSRTITYDPKGVFAEKPKADRSGISFTTLTNQQFKGKPKMCKLTVLIKNKDKKRVPNVAISVVSVAYKIKLNGRSNANGEALFYIPIGQHYEIDVENVEGYKLFSVPNMEGIEKIESVFFEKLNLVETIKGDTIIQSEIVQNTGTSTHILYTLKLDDYDGNPLPNEPVYAQATNGNSVYKGETNTEGKCSFMLKKGNDYVLKLKHENGIDLIKAPLNKGFRKVSCGRRYRGSEKIEEMLAMQKAEMERLEAEMREEALRPKPGDDSYAITYRETPTKPLSTPVDYLTKTTDGFAVNFDDNGTVGTPTVIGNRLFTQEGWYSRNYYCLNATTGAFVWGIALGEGGISPAVYHHGIILINTESCTLYAIDAKTGKLLWSKWLAGYLYSTPSADDKSVYVVYEHGGYPVTVSFDLVSGKLNWMHRVDDEVIACPVVVGNEVHLASQSGTYFVFNKENGKLIKMSNTYKMISSPTIVADRIYITASINGKEQILILDRKTLQQKKRFKTFLNSYPIAKGHGLNISQQMSFNGSHPIIYQNKYLVVVDSEKIMTFDIASERLLWQKKINTSSEQLPIITNEKIFIQTEIGLMSYSIKTGSPRIIKKTNGKPEGQPIVRNGLLYLSAGGILGVMKTLAPYNWGQWNKNASHNAVWE